MRPLAIRVSLLVAGLFVASLAAPVWAQVHHDPGGRPWNERASLGPDAEVPGWFYNLGPTGLRVVLDDRRPMHLLVRHVFADTPAHGRVRPGDWIVAAGGAAFATPHRNGYGMERFGAHGPIADFAAALERAQAGEGRRALALRLEREGAAVDVELDLGPARPAFAAGFPADCPRSAAIVERLLALLLERQREDGSWGDPVRDLYAPLALLAGGKREHLAAVERNARFHARTTAARDEDSLINWRYMSAAIVLAEYHLASGESWALPELAEVRDFLLGAQYLRLEQVSPRVRESHPDSYPKDAAQQRGGWGHNVGFEGYGPISMLTGQGAIAFALMRRCGLELDRARHDAAYEFLTRGSGRNGYVWYVDEAAGQDDWADMGRTGAAAVAFRLSPYEGGEYRKRALLHATVIGEHPESYPDTHGSPLLGMGWAAAGAAVHPASFRRLMDANRWWFVLAECADGSFYYQPNRDNAGYGDDPRLTASAVTAFVLQVPRANLALTGRERP